MGSRYVVGRIPLYLVLIGILFLTGCLLETWEGLVQDEYKSSRADRICHPYGDCEQGEWVRIGKSEIDAFLAYSECEDRFVETHGQWSEDTIVMGLEVGRCMKSKGYILARP